MSEFVFFYIYTQFEHGNWIQRASPCNIGRESVDDVKEIQWLDSESEIRKDSRQEEEVGNEREPR